MHSNCENDPYIFLLKIVPTKKTYKENKTFNIQNDPITFTVHITNPKILLQGNMVSSWMMEIFVVCVILSFLVT